MFSGHSPAPRRRRSQRRSARVAVTIAIPVALALLIGIVIVVRGQHSANISETALGASASPSASSSTTPATTTAANVNCDIIVPANPLSATGLATPYQLTGTGGMTPEQSGCTMTNAANLGAFVQATILNTRTGQVSVYDPLVITQGTTPAVAPTVPVLPRHYVATIDFGFNGTDLIQVGATRHALAQGNCVNGTAGSIFGQLSFCNGISFFNVAHQMEAQGRLFVPSEGRSNKIIPTGGRLGTGRACPVTHNFDMVDQDPSDNVTTEYLLNPATGQTAQDTTANAGNIVGSTLLLNGSDNTLLDLFMDPVLGCTPFQAPDLANNNQPTSSQALDELLAEKNGNTPGIAALVPENDEMTLDGQGQFDAAKTNLYRAEVGQTPINWSDNRFSSPAMYCQNMVNIQTPFLAANEALLGNRPGAGDRGRQQPVHVPGEQAQHVLHQPRLPELRPDRSGHRHPGRERRGCGGDLQHHSAAGEQHVRIDDAVSGTAMAVITTST